MTAIDTAALDTALAAIAADITVADPGAGPRQLRLSSGEVHAFGSAESPTSGLTECIYARHYCRPGQEMPQARPSDAAFLETLRAVCASSGQGTTIRDGITSGHYFLLGRPVVAANTGRQVRFYWNLLPDGAAGLLAMLAARLDRRRLPFQAKVPSTVAGYDRADAGVLYCAAEDVACVIDIVLETQAALATWLRPDLPLFTRALAPGLGFAESPQGGESFGMARSRLLAEGLLQARQGTDAIEAMRARLAGYGLRFDALERNAGTAYPYPPPIAAADR
ncbi:T3SS effector HopA1 family protein [Sphingomonas sp.]|uniref:T3SS effector HopA1 family protein n=1 Tax=Sphingomonas sp. TaxID=28214 RepID=UPI0028A8A86E|nr:T3SS effector HopA1 family protein [Sphingomonas sp.]